jgi:peroxiredoxin
MSAPTQSQQQKLNPVPLTLEGSSVLHQMVRFRWGQWRVLDCANRKQIAGEAAEALGKMEAAGTRWSGVYSLLGHKGDLLFVHFRESFDELREAQLALSRLRLWDYLEPTTSYVSVVELGLYESSVKLFRSLAEQNIQPATPQWEKAVKETTERQRQAMHARLFPEMPEGKYISFYPMDKRRGEQQNWYTLPIEERQRQMEDHGMIGRRWAGVVKQIITGSIGFDDWEWGVTLWANDPVEFKRLIYEMRFDEVSAKYALFGQFYTGIRVAAADLPKMLAF